MHIQIKYNSLFATVRFNAAVKIEETKNNNTSTASIAYEMQMQPVPADWNYCLQITKRPLQYKAVDANAADEVIEKLSSPLRLLELTIKKGMPEKIKNYPDIVKEWNEQIRPSIAASYTGNWVEAMLQKTDAIIFRPEELLHTILNKDRILQQYFSGIYAMEFNFSTHYAHKQYTLYNAINGYDLPISERWQYKATPSGSIIEITGQMEKQPDEKLNAIQVRKHGVYEMNNKTGWCCGFQCVYDIHDTNTDTKRKITLQLSTV